MKIRVRPTKGHPFVPYVDENDRVWMGRFVGVNADGSTMQHGEEVEHSAYYQRKLDSGALELLNETPAETPVETQAEVAPPSTEKQE